MGEVSKQHKKELLQKWKAEQNKKYILNKTSVKKLFSYLKRELSKEPCDHSLRRTERWIDAHCPPEKKEGIIQELHDMGGFCDCEVLMNCYERYELE